MKNYPRVLTLLVVSLILVTGCNGRRLLHGNHSKFARNIHALATRQQACPSKTLSVWFVKSDADGLKLTSVTRKVDQGDRLEQAVQELLRGPDDKEERSGLGTEIPRGTILLGVKRKDNNVEINLSHRFASSGGSTSFLTRLDQLKKTIAEPAGSTNVYLSVEGHRLNVEEGEGIEIRQPINR